MPSAVARCGAARPHGPRRSLDARPDFELLRERRGSALALPTLFIADADAELRATGPNHHERRARV
eukprot:scaffold58038_cov63-Phaeocystis_antarctica.AAC.2